MSRQELPSDTNEYAKSLGILGAKTAAFSIGGFILKETLTGGLMPPELSAPFIAASLPSLAYLGITYAPRTARNFPTSGNLSERVDALANKATEGLISSPNHSINLFQVFNPAAALILAQLPPTLTTLTIGAAFVAMEAGIVAAVTYRASRNKLNIQE